MATVIPPGDNKFAALNSAVWSGGSFVYVPPGVEVKMPLQAYFRINTENMGQFERTLIIADKGSKVHYIEGCTAPKFSTSSLHSAVVELIAMEGASIRYTTIQNWYRNIFNLVTKRAVAYKNATVEWVDGNIGSRLTMKYPAIYLMGEGARGEILSAAFAGEGQHQDAGAKVIHAAPNTTSVVTNKSVSAHGGKTTYRGLVEIHEGAVGAKTRVKCDALIMDDKSSSDTKPTMKIHEQHSTVEHEASVSKIGEEQLFYAMSRGLERSRRHRDDRQRLLRLLRQGAADGIRGRAQSLDQDGDGRLRRLTAAMAQAVARKSEIADGATKRVTVGEQSVLLCNVAGEIFAIEDVCTHDGGPLDEGELMGDRIMCPRHGAFFDVKSGAALTLPAIVPVQTFKVRTDGDDIFLEL